MPTFCRHNRFVERCPICSKTLPGNEPTPAAPRRARAGSASTAPSTVPGRRARGGALRVRREGRASEDGYRSELVPGLRASADAERLAAEIAFSSARLASLAVDPPGTYARALDAGAAGDFERATWTCFLIAYVCPAEDEQPFAAIDAVLAAAASPGQVSDSLAELLDGAQLGPRSSHVAGSGTRTLRAYASWVERAGHAPNPQTAAFTGDPGWAPGRRFARLFERLALPGLTRAARYELLVTLGRLGLYELSGESLQLSTARSGGEEDATTLAAKRVFGIADPLLIDKRATALAEAASVPLEALDLALCNWGATERATLGFRPPEELEDAAALAALGL